MFFTGTMIIIIIIIIMFIIIDIDYRNIIDIDYRQPTNKMLYVNDNYGIYGALGYNGLYFAWSFHGLAGWPVTYN